MINKKLINTGVAAPAPFDPLQNFETVTYTGNGGTQKITGYIRKGAAFNGSAYITTTPQTQQQEFSWSFWVNYTSTSLYSFIASVYTGSDVSGVPNALFINSQNNGRLALALGNNGSYIFNFNHTATGLNDGNWHHVLVSWDGTTNTDAVKFYIDNVVTTSTSSISAASLPNYSEFALGARAVDHIIPYTGSIDQVRFFNKALSQNEVDTLEAETYASSTKSTTDIFGDGSGVALYELDEDANDTGVAIDAGQSASFTNTNQNYIQLPSGIDTILNTKNFGLSLWVKAPNAATDAVFSTETTNSTFQIHANWGFAGAYALINGGGSDINLGAVDSNWHHIVVTSDGSSSYKGYFDKVYKGASTYRQTSNVGTFLGSHPSGGFNLEGQIDQVRIFNRQLSQSDIDSLYNETSPSTVDYFGDGNGKALYKLDNTPDDESGSYNATWNGTAAYIDEAANVKYDGTPTNVNFLGMAFQPDFVWTKSRSQPYNHSIYDSVRGVNKLLQSNTQIAEFPATNAFNSFDSNGFTLGANDNSNVNGESSVAWCWKAADTTTTIAANTVGNTIASNVRANQDAGFSIVKYTGTTNVGTVAHGLSQAPEMIIVKNLENSGAARHWAIYHSGVDANPENYFLRFTNNAKFDLPIWNDTAPTSTVFTLGDNTQAADANDPDDHIAYCFHSVDSYQRVSTYSGSGVSGKRVYTTDDGTATGNGGFRPRFVMYKLTSSSGHSWVMIDDVRSPSNPRNKYLLADSPSQEGTANVLNFTDDGFELLLTDLGTNALNETYIYLAIA